MINDLEKLQDSKDTLNLAELLLQKLTKANMLYCEARFLIKILAHITSSHLERYDEQIEMTEFRCLPPPTYREWKQDYILAGDFSYTMKKYKRWLRRYNKKYLKKYKQFIRRLLKG